MLTGAYHSEQLPSHVRPLSPTETPDSAEEPPKTKRQPAGPREGFTLKGVKPETITAIPYDIIKEGKPP